MFSGDNNKEIEKVEEYTYVIGEYGMDESLSGSEFSSLEDSSTEYSSYKSSASSVSSVSSASSASSEESTHSQVHENRLEQLKSKSTKINLKSASTKEEEKERAKAADAFMGDVLAMNRSKWGLIPHDSGLMKDVKTEVSSLYSLLNCPAVEGTFDEYKYFKNVGLIIEQFETAIDKAKIYLEKRKNPRTKNGKRRYEMVQEMLVTLEREKKNFPEAARAVLLQNDPSQLKESHITWSEVLFAVRAFEVPDGELVFDNTDAARVITIDDEEYQFKKQDYTVVIDSDKDGFFNTEKEMKGIISYYSKDGDLLGYDDEERLEIANDGIKKLDAFFEKVLSYYNDNSNVSEAVYIREVSAFHKTISSNLEKLPELNKRYALEKYLMAYDDLMYSSNTDMLDCFWNRLVELIDYLMFLVEKNNAAANAIYDEIKEKEENLDSFQDAYVEVARTMRVGARAKLIGIDEGKDLSLRNTAKSRYAKLHGMGDLVTESRTVTCKDEDGRTIHGNLTKRPKGKTLQELVDEFEKQGFKLDKVAFTRDAADKAVELSILDYMTGQTDRSIHNIMFDGEIRGDRLVITDLQGISNDYSFGKKQPYEIRKDSGNLALLQKDGVNRLKTLGKNVYEKFVDYPAVPMDYYLLDCGIGKEEIDALVEREYIVDAYIKNNISEVMEQAKTGYDSTQTAQTVDDMFYQEPGKGVFGVVKQFLGMDRIKVVDN